MPLTPNTSILLYAPFDKDNPGSTELKRKMTPKEFFEECFVYPNFDEKIQSLANSSNSEIDEHEVFLTKEEMIENLSNDKDGLDIFEKWLKDNASSPYVIMGDAGTGKTTLLHYYQYKNKGNHNWTILDLQEANRDIQIYNKLLCIEKKDTLKEMISSILIKEIVKILFMNRDGQKHNDKEIFKNILNIKKAFFVDNKHLLPLETTTLFFEKMPIIPFIYSKKIFKRLILYIYNFLEDILDYNKHKDPFEQVFDLYLNILDTQSKNESTVIVVDNVERFIKTTEIYSDDIIAFMKTLRNITDRHRSNSTINNINYFAEKFRFIISMRKTTIRLFTTQQTAEYLPHILDISDWFQISEIVDNKVKWLTNHSELNEINTTYIERLNYILQDVGFANGIARGLQQKLDLLFNYDKRIILEMLNRVLNNANNKQYLDMFDLYRKQTTAPALCRFAARSIIIRLILNDLSNRDEFTRLINRSEPYKATERLNYVRKILTVLLANKQENNAVKYTSIDSLIAKVICLSELNIDSFYNTEYYNDTLIELSKVLFFMNYYNRRQNNWIQLIDIQCNELTERTDVENETKMFEFLKKHHKNIKVSITLTGKAYLDYIVQSYEFFLCYYSDYPPLLCLVPSMEDLLNNNINDLQCIKIIKSISEKTIQFINNTLLNDEFLYYNYNGKFQTYKERIINHHCGHLDNFSLYVKKHFRQYLKNKDFKTKLHEFEISINDVKNQYLILK